MHTKEDQIQSFKTKMRNRGRLLIQCPDKPGIVAAVSAFLFANGANIIESNQFSNGKKSISRVDFDIYGYLVDQTERAPVDYLQYIDEAITPVMFDGMIQFDQDHKRVTDNIEAAKEKMANKKRKLLKA